MRLIRVPGEWCLVYLDKYNMTVVQIPGMMILYKKRTVYVYEHIIRVVFIGIEKDSRGYSRYFSMFTSN